MPKIQNLRFNDFEKYILSLGCVLVRIKGDHFIFGKPDLLRPLVIPNYKIIPEFIISNKIRTLRFLAAEMTQKDLADLVGVTRQTVNAIELNKYSPSLEVAFKMSQVFKVPLTDVFSYSTQDDE